MPTVALSQTVSVQLDGAGNGTASVGPLSAREVWRPTNIHVTVATSVNEASCDIFVGDAAQQRNFRDSTFTGSSGDSSDRVNADTVKVGAKIWAVWTGGDARAMATMTVTGEKDI